MTKSELIQRLSEKNPHLYLRDIEKIVETISEEISPLSLTISQLEKTAELRRQKMKGFNYNLSGNLAYRNKFLNVYGSFSTRYNEGYKGFTSSKQEN